MDFRYALRTLKNTPMFTLVVVLTLGLGIGANTALFSLTDQVLLRLLPVNDPEELVLFENPGALPAASSMTTRFRTRCTGISATEIRCLRASWRDSTRR